jgi:hypothetical protein
MHHLGNHSGSLFTILVKYDSLHSVMSIVGVEFLKKKCVCNGTCRLVMSFKSFDQGIMIVFLYSETMKNFLILNIIISSPRRNNITHWRHVFNVAVVHKASWLYKIREGILGKNLFHSLGFTTFNLEWSKRCSWRIRCVKKVFFLHKNYHELSYVIQICIHHVRISKTYPQNIHIFICHWPHCWMWMQPQAWSFPVCCSELLNFTFTVQLSFATVASAWPLCLPHAPKSCCMQWFDFCGLKVYEM